jgi:hypothetical protein
MPKRTAQDWEPWTGNCKRLHAAGVSHEEIKAEARRLLAQARAKGRPAVA